MYHAEDGEHENERTHELGEKSLYRTDITGIGRDAEAGVAGGHPQYADDGGRPDDRADHLRGDVGGHARPRELACDRESEGDRRVDVVAGDVSERVDRRRHDGGECERDHAKVGHRERRVPVDDDRGGHRSHADEDQEGGAERFGREFLGERRFVHDVLLRPGLKPAAVWCSTISDIIR